MESIEKIICKNLIERGLKIATAESCTGGLIAAKVTSVSGASGCFDCGIVSYSNEQKQRLLGVRPQTLEKYGAVSYEVAREMCEGVRRISGADIGVSVTGIAGPTGGTPEKPVGTVWIGISCEQGSDAVRFLFEGNRDEVRRKTVNKALEMANQTVLKLK